MDARPKVNVHIVLISPPERHVNVLAGDWMIFVGRDILCPVLSVSCYKLFINYILRLHVKSFIQARRDPSFALPRQNFPIYRNYPNLVRTRFQIISGSNY